MLKVSSAKKFLRLKLPLRTLRLKVLLRHLIIMEKNKTKKVNLFIFTKKSLKSFVENFEVPTETVDSLDKVAWTNFFDLIAEATGATAIPRTPGYQEQQPELSTTLDEDDEIAWQNLLKIVQDSNDVIACRAQTPDFFGGIEEAASQEIVKAAELETVVVQQEVVIARAQTPDFFDEIENVATQEIVNESEVVGDIVEEITSRCATPAIQQEQHDDDDEIESIHETPVVKKTKREEYEEDNIVVDLSSSSDDEDERVETKRRKIVVEPADDDSDDEEEVVRVMLYNSGEFAKVEKSSIVEQMKKSLENNKVKVVSTLQGVSNKIGTLFCVFDDSYVESKREIVGNSQLVNLAMEGRVRMTPLSSLISIVDEFGIDQLNLDALRYCSYERRREIVKFKSYVDTANMVHSRWRITPGSVVLPDQTPILRSKQEVLLYLRDQLFTLKN